MLCSAHLTNLYTYTLPIQFNADYCYYLAMFSSLCSHCYVMHYRSCYGAVILVNLSFCAQLHNYCRYVIRNIYSAFLIM